MYIVYCDPMNNHHISFSSSIISTTSAEVSYIEVQNYITTYSVDYFYVTNRLK